MSIPRPRDAGARARPQIVTPREQQTAEFRKAQAKFRREVLKQANYTCENCGRTKDQLLEGEHLVADHRVPLNMGGPNDPETNGRCLCSLCDQLYNVQPRIGRSEEVESE